MYKLNFEVRILTNLTFDLYDIGNYTQLYISACRNKTMTGHPVVKIYQFSKQSLDSFVDLAITIPDDEILCLEKIGYVV